MSYQKTRAEAAIDWGFACFTWALVAFAMVAVLVMVLASISALGSVCERVDGHERATSNAARR